MYEFTYIQNGELEVVYLTEEEVEEILTPSNEAGFGFAEEWE